MADEANNSIPAPTEAVTPKVTGDSPVNGSTHAIDTPQKDVAMMDVPTEHAAVRTSFLLLRVSTREALCSVELT